MITNRLALYTTVYPGVERYLSAWYESVVAQTDRNFDVWIGLDEIDVSDVIARIGKDLSVIWVTGDDGPVRVRGKAMDRMVSDYPAVIFVDSDDLLDPTRVESARKSLEEFDLSGCAMRIIDEDGNDLGAVFEPPPGEDIEAILTRYNVFGLSNTAYRSQVLRKCLPLPEECVLVDWFLVTRAWIQVARLGFDHICRMAYRQRSSSIALVLPPFTARQVISATEQVLNHYALVLANKPEPLYGRWNALKSAHERVEAFYKSIKNSQDILNQYVQRLNQLEPNYMWWTCVAHPKLEDIWKRK